MTGDIGSETPTDLKTDPVISPKNTSARGLRRIMNRARVLEKERGISKPNEDPKITRKHSIAVAAIETTSELAFKDPLTGLHNRRWLEDDLDRRIATAERSNNPLYVVFMDYDNFKDFNSAYGHAGGDKVIQLASRIHTRPDEPLSRYAGDEFIQSIEHQWLDSREIRRALTRYQETVLEESRTLLADLPVIEGVDPAAVRREVTMTFGVAKYEGESREELIRKANLAMLHAKTEGKNNAFIAEKGTTGSDFKFTQIK